MEFSLDDIYRCLTQVVTFKDSLQLHLHQKMKEKFGRSTELVYYDVTNYYFETDRQDELKRKGVSKEHRPDPIVQMGLLMDTKGIPVSYDLFPGNSNDCETLMPMLDQVKKPTRSDAPSSSQTRESIRQTTSPLASPGVTGMSIRKRCAGRTRS